MKGQRVLNTFSYTGSLSVASGLAGAEMVTSLDLSRPSLDWAKKNWSLNSLPEGQAEWIVGDYFDRLPLLIKKQRLFNCVILDPPSFSRSKKGTFSTQNDLVQLHELALRLIAPKGLLITSINSAQVTDEQYKKQINEALSHTGRKAEFVSPIQQPETFPVRQGHSEDRYLKGWVLSIF